MKYQVIIKQLLMNDIVIWSGQDISSKFIKITIVVTYLNIMSSSVFKQLLMNDIGNWSRQDISSKVMQ